MRFSKALFFILHSSFFLLTACRPQQQRPASHTPAAAEAELLREASDLYLRDTSEMDSLLYSK